MERITGNGAPTRTTAGVVGQHYEDLNTGNIYECLVASEHSKIHGPMMGGYIWKLKASGEDLEDHAAIFGGGTLLLDLDWSNRVCNTATETILNAYDNGVAIIARVDGIEYRPSVIGRDGNILSYLDMTSIIVGNGYAEFSGLSIKSDGTFEILNTGRIEIASGK